MKKRTHISILLLFVSLTFAVATHAQKTVSAVVLEDTELKRVVPTSFYFAGQSAETQIRNAAAAKFGTDRYVIAGMVDTSGYSTEISGKYEGFFITDSPVKIGAKTLPTGAYGFGFAAAGTIRIFDLSSRELFAVPTAVDNDMKRPRPLQMIADKGGVRLYKGKNYVVIAAR